MRLLRSLVPLRAQMVRENCVMGNREKPGHTTPPYWDTPRYKNALRDRQAIFRYIQEQGPCTYREVAECGLYTPTYSRNPERAANNWARRHVEELAKSGHLERVPGTGTSCSHPLRHRILEK